MKIPLNTIVDAIGALREAGSLPYDKATWDLVTRCLIAARKLEMALALESVEIVAPSAEKAAA